MNCVKYSPDGEHFASGGADGQVEIFAFIIFSNLEVITQKPFLGTKIALCNCVLCLHLAQHL